MTSLLRLRLPQNWGLGGLLWGLRGLLLLALPAAAAPPAPPVAPPGQSQCFQVQYLLRLPDLQSLHFIRDVEGLQAIDDGDDAAGDQRVAALTVEAADLRRDEAREFGRLALLLKSMAAPPDLQGWAAARADGFGRPLPLTKDAQRDAKANPQVVALLATLDESDALKSDTDGRLSALAAWLSLTHGAAGLWAGDVGELTAALHVALADHETPRLTADTARRLAGAAPPAAPAAARAALAGLVPPGGNLSALATVAPVTADPVALARAQDALLAAFAAGGLLAADGGGN